MHVVLLHYCPWLLQCVNPSTDLLHACITHWIQWIVCTEQCTRRSGKHVTLHNVGRDNAITAYFNTPNFYGFFWHLNLHVHTYVHMYTVGDLGYYTYPKFFSGEESLLRADPGISLVGIPQEHLLLVALTEEILPFTPC